MSKYQLLTNLLPRFYSGETFGETVTPPPLKLEDLAEDDPRRQEMIDSGNTEFRRFPYFKFSEFFHLYHKRLLQTIKDTKAFDPLDCSVVLEQSPGYQNGKVDMDLMNGREILAWCMVMTQRERMAEGLNEFNRRNGTLIRAIERLRELDDPS